MGPDVGGEKDLAHELSLPGSPSAPHVNSCLGKTRCPTTWNVKGTLLRSAREETEAPCGDWGERAHRLLCTLSKSRVMWTCPGQANAWRQTLDLPTSGLNLNFENNSILHHCQSPNNHVEYEDGTRRRRNALHTPAEMG